MAYGKKTKTKKAKVAKKPFKPCSKCKFPAKCKKAGKCLGKK